MGDEHPGNNIRRMVLRRLYGNGLDTCSVYVHSIYNKNSNSLRVQATAEEVSQGPHRSIVEVSQELLQTW